MPNVLVVDDNAGTREWLIAILEEAQFDVWSARDGRKAQLILQRRAFDLIITDISMPDEDGFGLIRAVRSDYPETKIIVISGRSMDTLLDARISGAHAAIRKPVTVEAVLDCALELLAQPK